MFLVVMMPKSEVEVLKARGPTVIVEAVFLCRRTKSGLLFNVTSGA
jgi:hypothetical protein